MILGRVLKVVSQVQGNFLFIEVVPECKLSQLEEVLILQKSPPLPDRRDPRMIKDFFLFLALGLVSLVLQSTWLSGPWVNPFRLDLIFILVIFLGTLNRLGLGLAVSVLLGMLVDVLSWGGLGLAMILYPLIFWIFSCLDPDQYSIPMAFSVITVLLFQIIYGFLVYFFQSLSRGLDFSRHLSFLILVQALITMVVSIPLLSIFKAFLGKKPSLS